MTATTLKQRFSPNAIGPLQIILLLAMLQLSVTLLTNGFALSADESMWHYIGRNWFRHGLIPYSGGVDNHSPLIFAVFGLSDKLFGVNYWFPRLLGTVCQSTGIYYVYKIAKHISGKQAGILAISFYGLSILWRCADGRYTSFTETYDVMFMIMSFYFFLSSQNNKRYFISGFMGAIAMGFRLSGVFGIITLFIASLHKNRANILAFCLGVLAGILFLALIGLLAGINLHNVFTYGFTDNFGAGSTTDHRFLWKLEQCCGMFFYSEMVLFYPLVIVYFFIKRKADWLILWAILEFIGINAIGNYARVDLKDLLPALSLISAFATSHLIDRYNISIRHTMIIVWLCFFPKLTEPWVNLKKLVTGESAKAEDYCHEPFNQPDESASKKLGLWIKLTTTPQEKVLVAGYGAQVQVYSERLSPSIYFNATQTRIAKARFYQDMQHNKASMILVPLFPQYKQYIDADLRLYIADLVAKDYYLDTCMYSYSVYKIKK